jgi:hypothetical protein
MTYLLKGNHETSDRRLDRVQEFDERSRSFPISAVTAPELRSRAWRCDPRLDQGREGACVGFAWSHELAATPVSVKEVTDGSAQNIYRSAQNIDEWPGNSYSGTSVLAGAKVCQAMGYIDSYHWAFSIDDVMRAISSAGPVVFGIPWLDSMYEPRPDGLLDCSGAVVGGHAILGRGLRLNARLRDVREPVVRLRNSWGRDWGVEGDGFIRVSDLERLLKDGGEACLPLGRHR